MQNRFERIVRMTKVSLLTTVAGAALFTFGGVGAARASDITPPPVPGNIAVDADQEVYLVGHGVGTQDYICLPSTTSITGVSYQLFTPEAALFAADGSQLTTHFFSVNPKENVIRVTWQDSRDSSTIWAKLLESSTDENFVAKGAVAWLKLQEVNVAAGPTGDRLTKTTFVQRLNTAGGLAPSTGCSSPLDIGTKAFVPYSADYFFYKKINTGR